MQIVHNVQYERLFVQDNQQKTNSISGGNDWIRGAVAIPGTAVRPRAASSVQ
jgi:hypothetical protein